MKPWRAALTSATASGKSTRIASRRAIACSSTLPCVSICESAAEVSSTAVLSVSVANCSRCASCTCSACCSANSRRLRMRSSGSPPKGKPPSMGSTLGERCGVPRDDLPGQLLHRRKRLLQRVRKGRAGLVAERLLEATGRSPECIEVLHRGDARLRPQRLGERARRRLCLLHAFGRLGDAQLREPRAQLVEVTAARSLLCHLAQRDERDGIVHGLPRLDRHAGLVEREPRPRLVGAEVDALAAEQLGGENAGHLLPRPLGGRSDPLQVVDRCHDAQCVRSKRARALCTARPDLRPLRATALLRTGPAVAPVPRLARPARRGTGARRRHRHGCRRDRARERRPGAHGRRHRPEPRDARGRPRARRAGGAQRPDRAAGRARGVAPVRRRRVRRAHVPVSAALRRRSARYDARSRPRRAARRRRRDARVRRPAWDVAPTVGAVRARRAATRRGDRVARLARGRPLPRSEHPRVSRARVARAAVARRRAPRRARAAPQPRRWGRRLGYPRVSSEVRPAFYALRSGGWRDYVTLLHPPYTLWHLSYAALGAAVAPHMQWRILAWTVLAFLLAMGIGAHALDEMKSRPLQTRIPDRVLVLLAAWSIAGACVIGVHVAIYTTWWLLAFIAFGAAIVVAYNLELFAGIVHTPFWFAAAWGAFPALTAFFASARTIRAEAVAIAGFAFVTSLVQQRLSVDVRFARRNAGDPAQAHTAEAALKLLAAAMPLLAAALLLARWH